VQNEGLVKASAGIAKTYAAQPRAAVGRTMGFKVLSYTDAQAQILLVENWPQRGQYTGFTVTLRWVDADWKILLEPTGQLSSTPDITVDPNGFTLGGGRMIVDLVATAAAAGGCNWWDPICVNTAIIDGAIKTVADETSAHWASVFMNGWAQLEMMFFASWVAIRCWQASRIRTAWCGGFRTRWPRSPGSSPSSER
jgi:hypothetical protein